MPRSENDRPAHADFAYFLREARRRPLGFLLRKLRAESLRRGRGVLASVGISPYRSRLPPTESPGVRHLLSATDMDCALEFLDEEQPDELRELLRLADRIAAGEIQIFSRTLTVDGEIDWHQDFVSGRRWTSKFHSRYSYAELLDFEHPSDVKVPWELSRLQFLPILALGYRLTRRARYLTVLRETLRNWDISNPVGYGVNWTVGMEAALRAISLIWTATMLAGTPGAAPLLEGRLLSILSEHGRFLFRNLEYSDVAGNHYTSCLVGLLYLGLFIPWEPEAETWVSEAAAELNRQIERQVYPDGVCHEGSIPYHRLVLELFLHAALLCRRHDLPLSDEYYSRLEKMFEFTLSYTKPSGEAPVWGDTDDGRVLTLGSQGVNDHRYLLAVGGALLDRADLVAASGPPSLDAAVLFDTALLQKFSSHSRAQGATVGGSSSAYPDGGFFILREGSSYCLIDCGDVGLRGRGGHGHNDALSIELSLAGIDVLTDTGAASYTRLLAERVRTLSVRSHNVAILDEREPAVVSLARLPHSTACPVQLVSWEPRTNCFVGRHRGYSELTGVELYERRVHLRSLGGELLIADKIMGSGEHAVEWCFHFAEVWKEVQTMPNRIRMEGPDGHALELLYHPTTARAEAVESVYYPSYDAPRRRRSLFLRISSGLPVEATFLLKLI